MKLWTKHKELLVRASVPLGIIGVGRMMAPAMPDETVVQNTILFGLAGGMAQMMAMRFDMVREGTDIWKTSKIAGRVAAKHR